MWSPILPGTKGKAPSRSAEDEGSQSDRLLKLELDELSLADELHRTALSVRPFTSLPFANPYLELATRQSSQLQSSMKDILQVIPCIIKGLSISPDNVELWNRLTDVATCTPRLRCLYSQAKVLNLMRQAALRQSIKAGPTDNLAKLVRQWFERRLDLLILMMMRRRYVKGDVKLLLRHGQHLAKSLLWFLLKCTDRKISTCLVGEIYGQTCSPQINGFEIIEVPNGPVEDYGEVLTYTAEVLHEAPAAEDWLHLATLGSHSQPLLHIQISAQGPADALGKVLGYLNDACQVEKTARDHQQALAVEGLASDFTYGVCEPWFRLQKLRVQLCLKGDEGWPWAATQPFGYTCESLNETVADAIQGLDACVIFDKSYQHKVDVLKASIELHFKEWDNASQWAWSLRTGVLFLEEQEKLRAVFICLGLYKGLLQECLPGAQVSVPTDLKAFSRLEASFKETSHGMQSLGYVHPGHRTKVQQEIRNLTSERKSEKWQALQEVTSKLASYATRVVDLSDNFRTDEFGQGKDAVQWQKLVLGVQISASGTLRADMATWHAMALPSRSEMLT
eukprot:s1020_g14.t1